MQVVVVVAFAEEKEKFRNVPVKEFGLSVSRAKTLLSRSAACVNSFGVVVGMKRFLHMHVVSGTELGWVT
jgi:hypothetical protein